MFKWLKPYMPRGLYSRAALILLLPVVSLQIIVSVVFLQRHFEDVTRQMTRSVALELSYLSEGLAPPESRGRARALAEALDYQLTSDLVATPTRRAFYDFSGRIVEQELRAALPGIAAIDLCGTGSGCAIRNVLVQLDLPEGPQTLIFDRERVSASNPHQLLVIMAVLGTAMTLISYLYLRNQLRPITRLAAAASAFGRGQTMPYSPSGALEVRAAGMAFLDMRARIERQAQARTMMLSGVSHDLRTPLTRLRLGLSLLDPQEAAPMEQDLLDMERMLDAFLDFARGDASEVPEPTDLGKLLHEVAAAQGLGGPAVELGHILLPDKPVRLRPLAIRRALDNLISNARRHGGHVRLSAQSFERALVLTVEDDGPGIPSEQRAEAVRPFSQLDPARNQNRGSGVGLGLAIVSDIARTHGGTLRLDQSADLGGLRADLVVPL